MGISNPLTVQYVPSVTLLWTMQQYKMLLNGLSKFYHVLNTDVNRNL